MPRIAILGSTGSIGTSALDVARTHADRVEVVAIAAASNVPASARNIGAARNPPTAPSRVFFGLRAGASGVRPNVRPA